MQIIHKHRSAVLLAAMSAALCLVWLFMSTAAGGVQGASEIQAPQDVFEINQLGPNSAFADNVVVYTIFLTNTSSGSLSNIIITDTQSTKMAQDLNKTWEFGVLLNYINFTTVPANAVSSSSYNINQVHKRGELTLHLNPVAAGGTVRIMISARVPITLQPALKSYLPFPDTAKRELIGPSTVENAVVAVQQGQQYRAPLATTQIIAPVLTLSKSAQGEVAGKNECRIGRLVTYTLVVKNAPYTGSGSRSDTHPAGHLVVRDVLPEQIAAGLLAQTASVPGVNFAQSGAEVEWTYPNTFVLDPGKSVTMTLVARVPHSTAYEPNDAYLVNEWEDFTAHADAMPFRDAALQSDHRARIFGPFEKTVETQAPKPGQTYPNRVITYTITFYNPYYNQSITNMTMYDTLPIDASLEDAFTFIKMAQGSTVDDPDVISKTLIWKNVAAPANGVITASFQMYVSPQLLAGRKCANTKYTNAVSGTVMGVTYNGHDDNKYAPLFGTRQIDPKKTVSPATQIAGSEITYTISLRNLGKTTIYPPLVITDEIPLDVVYLHMADPFPGEPTMVSETLDSKIYRWDNVLDDPIEPGETVKFSFIALADQVNLSGVINAMEGYNEDTSICQTTAKVVIIPGIHYNKTALQDIVIQGELVSYTVQVLNLSHHEPFTLTEFRDLLESVPLKGTRDIVDGDEEYNYVLPTPYFIDKYPYGNTWEHTFPARLVGYGIGEPWCEMLKNPAKGVIYQRGSDVQKHIVPGGWYRGFPTVKIAPFCAVPHFSLFQKVYPNPISVGQQFTMTLTLRDNRVNPPSALSGITLTWSVPLSDSVSGKPVASFKILDSTLPPDEIGDGSYQWRNLTVPAAGSLTIMLTVQAPMFEKDGWKKSYGSSFRAEVSPLADRSICVPPAEQFVVGETLSKDCDGDLEPLVMNQGIELDKYPDQTEVPPYSLLTYRIVAKNLTGAPVKNVLITDTLPSLGELHWEYMNMWEGPEPLSTDPLVWLIEEIPAEESVELYFSVRTHQFLGFEYNQLDGTAPIHLGLNAKYTDHVEVKVISGIGFFKAANPDHIAAGDTTTYTIMFNNGSEDKLESIIITDTLPDGFTYTHMIEPSALVPTINGQQLVWELQGELKTGQTYQLIYGVTTSNKLYSGLYLSSLEAAAQNAVTNELVEVPSTDEAGPVTVQGEPQVLADKTAKPSTVGADEIVTYTLTLFNETTMPQQIILTDTLPMSFSFVAPVGGTAMPQVVSGEREEVVWTNLGTIQPNQKLTLVFQARSSYLVKTGIYCNDVQVKMGDKLLPKRTPEDACVRAVQIPRVDIEISKSDGKTRIEGGEWLEYTIQYTNSIDSEAPVMGVIITDTFAQADYADLISYGPEWQQVLDDQFVYFVTEKLAPGESRSITFSVKLTTTIPSSIENIENRVEISYYSTEETMETNVLNNLASDFDFFKGPDLVISSLTITPESLAPGEPMTVAVVVTNLGDPVTHRWDGSQGNPNELFAVEVYLRRRPSFPPQDVFDHDEGWERGDAYLKWIDGRLDTNESTTVNFPLYVPSGGGNYDIYAQVDVSQGTQTFYWGRPWGLILELDEANNITAAYPVETTKLVYLPVVMRQYQR